MLDSAERLASMLISRLSSQNSDGGRDADSFEKLRIMSTSLDDKNDENEIFGLMGDIMMKKGDNKRALKYFRKALQQQRLLSPVSTVGINSSDNSTHLEKEMGFKFKVARILVNLKDFGAAQKEIESLPADKRDASMNLLLGNLYKIAGLKRHATSTYKLAFEQMPYAVEIIEALISLGMNGPEMWDLISKNSVLDIKGDDAWLASLADALISKRSASYENCNEKFRSLLDIFPHNPYLLSQLGCAAYEGGFYNDAIQSFRAARRQDSMMIENLDIYGAALFEKKDQNELHKLTQEIISIDPTRPEGWLCAALYSLILLEQEKALTFAEKAMQLAPKHAHCYRVKGKVFLEQQRGEQAVISYFQASSLERHIDAYRGLVDANLSMRKFPEALTAGKDAVSALPQCAQAYQILGLATISSSMGPTPEASEEASQLFAKALELDPRCEKAALNLADIYINKGPSHYVAAATLMTKTLVRQSSVALLTCLGKVRGLMGDYESAIGVLNKAIAMANDPAIPLQELERVESLLRNNGNGEVMENSHSHLSQSQELTLDHSLGGSALGSHSHSMDHSGSALGMSAAHMGVRGDIDGSGDLSGIRGSPLNQPDFGGFYT